MEKINAELFVTVGDNGQISLWSTRKKTPLCCKSLAHDKDQNGVPNWISAMAVLKCSDFVYTEYGIDYYTYDDCDYYYFDVSETSFILESVFN